MRNKYIIGGNEPTGGIEDGWFVYSHGSYYGEVPDKYLTNNYRRFIDRKGNVVKDPIFNPYFSKYKDIWGKYKGKNLSLPILVKPEDKRKY